MILNHHEEVIICAIVFDGGSVAESFVITKMSLPLTDFHSALAIPPILLSVSSPKRFSFGVSGGLSINGNCTFIILNVMLLQLLCTRAMMNLECCYCFAFIAFNNKKN